MAFGDRPLFEALQRLGIPDMTAVSTLGQAAVERAIAGLLGRASGVLTVPPIDASAPGSTTIGACYLYDGDRLIDGESRLPEGRVLRHNPSDSWQTSVVDLSKFAAGTDYPFIWARRAETATHTDTRRKWDVTAGEETSISPNTRTSERVEFSAAKTKPSGDGWFRIGMVTSWFDGTPVVTPMHALDWRLWRDVTYDNPPSSMGMYWWSGIFSGSGERGIIRHLYEIRKALAQILTSSADEWDATPARAMDKLHSDLSTAEANISTLKNHPGITDRVAAFARVRWDGAEWVQEGSQRNVTSVTTSGTMLIVEFGVEGDLIEVHPHYDFDGGGGFIYPRVPTITRSKPSSASTWSIRLWALDTDARTYSVKKFSDGTEVTVEAADWEQFTPTVRDYIDVVVRETLEGG